MIGRRLFVAMGGLWMLAASALAGCATSPAAPPRPPYDRLYVFGDSYSDTGYGYIDGNGPTAVGYLAQAMGLELSNTREPNWQGKSLNFAVSGAQTGEGAGRTYDTNEPGRTLQPRLSYGMQNQTRDFVALVTSKQVSFDPDRTLFFIAGGLNDSRLTTDVTEANLTRIVTALKDVGARHFEIAILPEKIPSFTAVGTRLNPMLLALPAKLNAQLGVQATTSRWGGYMDEVMVNATALGFTNTKDKCAGRGLFSENTTPCAEPDHYFFYHEGHPSTAVHKLVGQKLYQELTP